MTVKFFQHALPETFVNYDILVTSIEAILLGKLHQMILEGSCDQDSMIFGWVSMEENLTSIQKFMRIGCVDMFNFFRSNVFSLLQFEYVFLPVDNLEGIELWHNLDDIAWFQPSIFSDGLSSFLRLFVVSKKDMRASDPALSSRRWNTIDNVISCVFHLRDIACFYFNGRGQFGKLTVSGISGVAVHDTCWTFSLAVSFDERTAHDYHHVLVILGANWGTACGHDSDSPSETLSYFWKDNWIIEGACALSVFLNIFKFRGDCLIDQPFLYSTFCLKFSLNCINNLIVQSGNWQKHCRLYDLTIIF